VVSGYNVYGQDGGAVAYAYVLGTGAGWAGTIGSADIVARMPYEVNEHNFDYCYPENCDYSGTDVSWYFDDFEPEGNVELIIIRPSIWKYIIHETEHTEKYPNDGEAWGRLGKAYKELITGSKGIISLHEVRDYEMFDLSAEAYSRAVDLLPGDSDWHYGYAELLCNRAIFTESTDENWRACLVELKAALDLDPNHERALSLLEWIGLSPVRGVDLSGDQPVFLLLTATPSQKSTATEPSPPTPTLTIVADTQTPTSTSTDDSTAPPTETPEPETPTEKVVDEPTITAGTATTQPTLERDFNFILYIVAALAAVGIFIFFKVRKG